MKKEYITPELEIFEFKIFDNLLANGDDVAYYGSSISSSAETPVPGYNENVDDEFDFDLDFN